MGKLAMPILQKTENKLGRSKIIWKIKKKIKYVNGDNRTVFKVFVKK